MVGTIGKKWPRFLSIQCFVIFIYLDMIRLWRRKNFLQKWIKCIMKQFKFWSKNLWQFWLVGCGNYKCFVLKIIVINRSTFATFEITHFEAVNISNYCGEVRRGRGLCAAVASYTAPPHCSLTHHWTAVCILSYVLLMLLSIAVLVTMLCTCTE